MVAVQGELWASLAISTPVENFNYGTIFNRYWHDSRMEFIVLASDLTTAGFQANDEIREIRQWVEVVPDTPRTVTNARVALKHTAGTTFSTGNFSNGHAYSTFTEVFYRASMDFTVPQSWASFVLDTPFVWNGTDNLIIHFSRDTSSFSDNGQTRVRTIGTNRTRLAYHDSEVAFPFDNKSASLFTVAPRTYIVAERGGSPVGADGEITLGLTQQIYSDSSVNLSLTQKIYADISANLDLIQTIYRDAESLLGLNQMIYKDSEAVLNFNQAIYQESEKSLNLRQEIYTEAESILNLIQEFYEDSQTYITLQLIQQIYKDNSSDLPLTQVIYQDREINLPLRQEMYEEKETNVSLTQTIYNDNSSVLNLSQTIYRDSFSAMNLAQQMYSEGEITLPILIEIRDDLIQYNEVIRLILNITRKQSEIILLSRKQVATIDVTQRMQSELKL